jgi:hypothetical protein
MDPRKNPFTPGAGTPPPALAGRDTILASADVALDRVLDGRNSQSVMLLGLRGVGKTVLLNHLAEIAESKGYVNVVIESPEDQPLARSLVPKLRAALFRLSRSEKAEDLARRGLSVLRSFAAVFKVSFGEMELGVAPELGTADSGNLEADLPELLLTVAEAAKADGRAVALFIDEVQYLGEADLAALVVSVHRASQKRLPLLMFGAGLPQTAALAGEAKSYAERLFQFPEVGALAPDAAATALRGPIRAEGANIEDDAVQSIVDQTRGYPYFLQEWGQQAWNLAVGPCITVADARSAADAALAGLDASFFRVRFDRLTPKEKAYVRAMAELGPGPHRSGDIAAKLGKPVENCAPLRTGIIKKGMIYSPQHGDTAFTVPMFDAFMRRTMPDWPGMGQ